MSETPYVHVIMPIGSDPHAREKKVAIAEGAQKAGFEARFPDYLPHKPVFELDELVKEIRKADTVIADLSLERPSCYYELGIAELLAKKLYLFAENGTRIHQSAGRHLVRYYSDSRDLSRIVEVALTDSRGHNLPPAIKVLRVRRS